MGIVLDRLKTDNLMKTGTYISYESLPKKEQGQLKEAESFLYKAQDAMWKAFLKHDCPKDIVDGYEGLTRLIVTLGCYIEA